MNEDARRQAPLRPDSRLAARFANEAERRTVTRALFDQAASGYDRAEGLTALGRGPWYRRDVLRRHGLRAGMSLLDVAAGTGLVTVAGYQLVGPTGRVIALDPSPGMLAELRKKVAVDTIEAYAESIPLPDEQVDFVSMGYALRHVVDLNRAFPEYLRVLRPGGRVCIMEISRPRSRLARALLRFHIGALVPLLARLMRGRAGVKPLWEYYGDTIEAAIEPERILEALRRAGFAEVSGSVTFGIFREYTGRKA